MSLGIRGVTTAATDRYLLTRLTDHVEDKPNTLINASKAVQSHWQEEEGEKGETLGHLGLA